MCHTHHSLMLDRKADSILLSQGNLSASSHNISGAGCCASALFFQNICSIYLLDGCNVIQHHKHVPVLLEVGTALFHSTVVDPSLPHGLLFHGRTALGEGKQAAVFPNPPPMISVLLAKTPSIKLSLPATLDISSCTTWFVQGALATNQVCEMIQHMT